MNADWQRLATFADVEIWARWMDALVTDVQNLVLANIATSMVAERRLSRLAHHNVSLLVHLGKRMTRMNLLRDVEATLANVVIGTDSALVPQANDARRAQITCGRVLRRLCWARRVGRARDTGQVAR